MQAEPTRSFAAGQTAPRMEPENYLKNAEMATEDDCGMVDGIINNGRKDDPIVSVQKECSKPVRKWQAEPPNRLQGIIQPGQRFLRPPDACTNTRFGSNS